MQDRRQFLKSGAALGAAGGFLNLNPTAMGNISYKLKRDVVFDPKTETFGSDKQANALLTKQYRAPYALPAV